MTQVDRVKLAIMHALGYRFDWPEYTRAAKAAIKAMQPRKRKRVSK